MSDDYVLEITLRGPEGQNDRGYANRETLAEAKLAISPSRGWSIYLGAVDDAISPTFDIKESD